MKKINIKIKKNIEEEGVVIDAFICGGATFSSAASELAAAFKSLTPSEIENILRDHWSRMKIEGDKGQRWILAKVPKSKVAVRSATAAMKKAIRGAVKEARELNEARGLEDWLIKEEEFKV